MSTETTEANDPRVTADRLGREIFESLFPHGGPEMGAHHADRKVPKEFRLPKVKGPQDVKPGDIVLVVDDKAAWRGTLHRFSAREALKGPSVWVARVHKVSHRSVVVDHIRNPRRHGFSADLDDFGATANDGGERLMFNHATREIGRVGTLTELREKIAAHPLLAEWRAARAAALDIVAAEDAQAKANREAKEARLASVKAAVEGFNAALRLRKPLVELSSRDDIKATSEWLAENDFLNLKVYVCGLNALGTITDERQVEALHHLDVITAYAKGEK